MKAFFVYHLFLSAFVLGLFFLGGYSGETLNTTKMYAAALATGFALANIAKVWLEPESKNVSGSTGSIALLISCALLWGTTGGQFTDKLVPTMLMILAIYWSISYALQFGSGKNAREKVMIICIVGGQFLLATFFFFYSPR